MSRHAKFNTYDLVQEIDFKAHYVVLDYDIKRHDGSIEVEYELVEEASGLVSRRWESSLSKVGHYKTPLAMHEVVIAKTDSAKREGVVTGISGIPGQAPAWGFTVQFKDGRTEYFELQKLTGTGKIDNSIINRRLAAR